MTDRARAVEVNFDRIAGPTHNHAALAFGNLPSQTHGGEVSSPRRAALEGLAKMKLVADLGVPQAVLPPQRRPRLDVLERLGFTGSAGEISARALREAPALLAAACSASDMWMANAATVSPSADTGDGRVHLTPANLSTFLHRSMEADETAALLSAVFPDAARFAHHPPLPGTAQLGDEGAANHLRLCRDHGEPGLEVFVYGRRAFGRGDDGPRRHPARHALEASQAVARLHRLAPGRVRFVQQSPGAIDAGVFHNDVAAVSNCDVLLCHEGAFAAQADVLDDLRRAFERACGGELRVIEVREAQIPLAEAARVYLFNSQLLGRPDGDGMVLLCPAECAASPAAMDVLEALVADARNPVASFRLVEVRESMKNGGGPACLRLRVPLSRAELAGVRCPLLGDALYDWLVAWVGRHYRDRLALADLADPALPDECARALDEVHERLGLSPGG